MTGTGNPISLRPYECDFVGELQNYADGQWRMPSFPATRAGRSDVFKPYGKKGPLCYGKEVDRETVVSKKLALRWQWVPHSSCMIAPTPDVEKAADLEQKLGPTLFVGDSLLEQFFEAWNNSIGGVKSSTYVQAPILVDSWSLRPMLAEEYMWCQASAKVNSPKANTRFLEITSATSSAPAVPPNIDGTADQTDTFPRPLPPPVKLMIGQENDPPPLRTAVAESHWALSLPSPCPPQTGDPTDVGGKYKAGIMEFSHHLEQQRWTTALRDLRPQTLVLNTGAHWWKESYFASDIEGCRGSLGVDGAYVHLEKEICDPFDKKYAVMVHNVAQFLRVVGFNGRVIFVTFTPGFSGCDDARRPGPPIPGSDPWHWKPVSEHERIWADVFAKTIPELQFHVLNITALSHVRGDMHPSGDCLHYCEPGVPDLWARMLFQFADQLS